MKAITIFFIIPSGDYETFMAMLLDGYDHIIDLVDADGMAITQIAKSRGHLELVGLFDTWREFEVSFM